MHKLYENTTTFYVKDLSIRRFRYQRGVLKLRDDCKRLATIHWMSTET
jgi:hypothetical protein